LDLLLGAEFHNVTLFFVALAHCQLGARLAQMGRDGNEKNAHFLRTEGKEELASECIV
jgi:hypothetical protein